MRISERHYFTAALSLSLLVPLWLFNNCATDVQFSSIEVLSLEDSQGASISDTTHTSNPPLNLPPAIQPPERNVVQIRQQVQIDKKPLDILFVIDNSGSMTAYQQNMGERISGFLDHLEGLDWQIAVTSTDPNEITRDRRGHRVSWGDGQFRSFLSSEHQPILRANDPSTLGQAQLLLANAIEMGARGSGDERGIRATYRALERRSSDIGQAAFFRQDSALAVVLISDEDECSNGVCSTSHSPEKSLPENLLEQVRSQFGKEKRFVFNSFIHKQGQCPGAHRAAREGNTYRELSNETGGLVGLVCAEDYGQQLSDLGSLVKQLAYETKLACEPLEKSETGAIDLKIMSNDGLVETSFSVEENNLLFSSGLPSGSYTLEYSCYEDEI